MRLHSMVLVALLAFPAQGPRANSDRDVFSEGHWSAGDGPGETTSAGPYGDGSFEAHESAWGGPGETTHARRGAAVAESSKVFDFGKREYEARCAGCHGSMGKGDGVNRAFLDRSPPDLTELAKTHGGEFPYEEFYAAVDGRSAQHIDMPCFAKIYAEEARSDHLDVPYDEDRYLETRLVALVDYVEGLQVK